MKVGLNSIKAVFYYIENVKGEKGELTAISLFVFPLR